MYSVVYYNAIQMRLLYTFEDFWSAFLSEVVLARHNMLLLLTLMAPCLKHCKQHFLSSLCPKVSISPTLVQTFFQL